jgi:hypothetical protein
MSRFTVRWEWRDGDGSAVAPRWWACETRETAADAEKLAVWLRAIGQQNTRVWIEPATPQTVTGRWERRLNWETMEPYTAYSP